MGEATEITVIILSDQDEPVSHSTMILGYSRKDGTWEHETSARTKTYMLNTRCKEADISAAPEKQCMIS